MGYQQPGTGEGEPPLLGHGDPPERTCKISDPAPPCLGHWPPSSAESSKGLAARTTLQHCISNTATTTALAIIAMGAI